MFWFDRERNGKEKRGAKKRKWKGNHLFKKDL